MNIAFFGSPPIAKTILSSIHKSHGVSVIVTQPDKHVGRKRILTPTPVKQFAIFHSIPVLNPTSLLQSDEVEKTLAVMNIDIAIVVAYGLIIPESLLAIPTYGFVNVHYSLLPYYRGASPVQSTLLAGDTQTGTTIMHMDRNLDHGDCIFQKEMSIDTTDTSQSLLEKLTDISIPLLIKTLDIYKNKETVPSIPQDHDKATYTRRLAKKDGFIEYKTLEKILQHNGISLDELPHIQQEIITTIRTDNTQLTSSAGSLTIHNFIRALYPWPCAWTLAPTGRRVKLISSEYTNDRLTIMAFQEEGKNITYEDFSKHYAI